MKRYVVVFAGVLAVLLMLYGSSDYSKLTVTGVNTNVSVCGDSVSQATPLEDFYTYPCLGKDPNISPEVIPAGCVRTVCRQPTRGLISLDDKCDLLKQVNTEICTYPPSQDLVSRIISETGEWEPHLVNNLLDTLKAHPELVFLDIGCNIGVFTLAAASARTMSICVDANQENLRLVTKSVSRGRLENYVTLVWNALSDQRGLVNFQIIKGNAGASRIGDISKYNMTKKKDISVNAIVLDDLQWLVRGKRLFIKIDAESHELFILKGAREFFKTIDVQIIQMELVEPDTFNSVVVLLKDWGFSMFRDPFGKVELDETEFKTNWPGDMYFIRNNT